MPVMFIGVPSQVRAVAAGDARKARRASAFERLSVGPIAYPMRASPELFRGANESRLKASAERRAASSGGIA
jgi:hypothetical protein